MGRNYKLTQAFTIIELITVMIIIMILVGLIVGAGTRARMKAIEVKTEAMIAALETAIAMYRIDTSQYPPDDAQLSTAPLVSHLTQSSGVSNWRGPYMEFKDRDLSAGEIIDPWGNPYRYDNAPTGGNTASFNLWSYGADGVNDSSDPNSDPNDDIRNW